MQHREYDRIRVSKEMERTYSLGLSVITNRNTHDNYDFTHIWAIGLGTLDGNHDVSNYDPSKYSGTELLVLALQDRFEGIGGRDVKVTDYVELVRKHYPEDVEDVLCVTIASKRGYSELVPVTITEEYHPPLESLARLAVGMANINDAYVVKHSGLIWNIINKAVSNLMFDIHLDKIHNTFLGKVGVSYY